MFLLLKAFHIISMVAWFAGLFYLPRLFVYHSDSNDEISIARFKVMERRLYYGITWPAAIVTVVLGIVLICYNPGYYLKAGWMHAKIALVLLLIIYHLYCGHFLRLFNQMQNAKSSFFYRIFNEIPTLFLISIVILVVLKPEFL